MTLDRNDAAAARCQGARERAAPGSRLDHQVARGEPCVRDDLVGQRGVAQEVL
jgi:hypothetical protein